MEYGFMNWFGKKNKEPEVLVTNEDKKPVDVEVTIPEPIVTKVEYNGNPSGHVEFNTIIEFENVNYRVTSQNSHEVVRLNCVTKTYDFEDARDEEGCYGVYIKNIKEERWCKKLYITDQGRFFWQCVYGDDTVGYFPITRADMHKQLANWEDPDRMNKPTSTSDLSAGDWITKPGTYKNKHCMSSGRYYCSSETFFESYEVINKELYDTKLIEVF